MRRCASSSMYALLQPACRTILLSCRVDLDILRQYARAKHKQLGLRHARRRSRSRHSRSRIRQQKGRCQNEIRNMDLDCVNLFFGGVGLLRACRRPVAPPAQAHPAAWAAQQRQQRGSSCCRSRNAVNFICVATWCGERWPSNNPICASAHRARSVFAGWRESHVVERCGRICPSPYLGSNGPPWQRLGGQTDGDLIRCAGRKTITAARAADPVGWHHRTGLSGMRTVHRRCRRAVERHRSWACPCPDVRWSPFGRTPPSLVA